MFIEIEMGSCGKGKVRNSVELEEPRWIGRTVRAKQAKGNRRERVAQQRTLHQKRQRIISLLLKICVTELMSAVV